jgi:hypothetical protein
MTTANKITILRILLIPFFVVELIYYVRSGNEAHRLAGVAVLRDRRDFGRRGRLHRAPLPSDQRTGKNPRPARGQIALGFRNCHVELQPRKFPRPDSALAHRHDHRTRFAAAYWVGVIRYTVGKVVVHPRFLGKIATVLQMAVVIWILLKWDNGRGILWLKYLTLGAAICTGISGLALRFGRRETTWRAPGSSPTKN